MGRASTATVAPFFERVPVVSDGSDDALVAAVRAGDDRAFERLFSRYQHRISAFVHALVSDRDRAEDVTQEVFLSALRRMRETKQPIAFKPWIYAIARNAAIDEFRRTQRAREVFVDTAGEVGAEPSGAGSAIRSAPSPDVAAGQKQALRDLCGAFGGLSDSHHEVLVLRELEGLSYREIGERLGLSQAAVESTLFRARRRLSEEYAQLASGERCADTQSMMGPATDGALTAHDLHRFVEHVSHCEVCRRHARAAGVDRAVLDRPSRRRRFRTLGQKVGAFLPFPVFWRKLRGQGGPGAQGSAGVAPAGSRATDVMAQLSAAAPVAEPLAAGWSKAAAAAATVVLAGVGAGVGSGVGGTAPEKPLEPLAARANADPTPTRAAANAGGLGITAPSSGVADPRARTAERVLSGAAVTPALLPSGAGVTLALLPGADVTPAVSPGVGPAAPAPTGAVVQPAPAPSDALPGGPDRIVEPGGRPQVPDAGAQTAPTVPRPMPGTEPVRPLGTDVEGVRAPHEPLETGTGGRAPADLEVAPPIRRAGGPGRSGLPPAAAAPVTPVVPPARDVPAGAIPRAPGRPVVPRRPEVPRAPGRPVVPPRPETPGARPVVDRPSRPLVEAPLPPADPQLERPRVGTPPAVAPRVKTPDLPAAPPVPKPPAVDPPDNPLGAG